MITISPADFLLWQIQHYAVRMGEAKSVEERAFLRRELYNLKRVKHADDA